MLASFYAIIYVFSQCFPFAFSVFQYPCNQFFVTHCFFYNWIKSNKLKGVSFPEIMEVMYYLLHLKLVLIVYLVG